MGEEKPPPSCDTSQLGAILRYKAFPEGVEYLSGRVLLQETAFELNTTEIIVIILGFAGY